MAHLLPAEELLLLVQGRAGAEALRQPTPRRDGKRRRATVATAAVTIPSCSRGGATIAAAAAAAATAVAAAAAACTGHAAISLSLRLNPSPSLSRRSKACCGLGRGRGRGRAAASREECAGEESRDLLPLRCEERDARLAAVGRGVERVPLCVEDLVAVKVRVGARVRLGLGLGLGVGMGLGLG